MRFERFRSNDQVRYSQLALHPVHGDLKQPDQLPTNVEPRHDVPLLFVVYGVVGCLEVDEQVVRKDLLLSALLEDLP